MSENPKNAMNTARSARRRNRGGNSRFKDVQPQWLSLGSVTETAANTFTQGSCDTPIVMQLGNGKAMVMELLKIQVLVTPPSILAATQCTVNWYVASKSMSSSPLLSEPSLIAFDQEMVVGQAAITPGAPHFQVMKTYDLQDANGRGIICGSRHLYMGILGANNGAAKNIQGRILYRLIEVNAQELIGIISDS